MSGYQLIIVRQLAKNKEKNIHNSNPASARSRRQENRGFSKEAVAA